MAYNMPHGNAAKGLFASNRVAMANYFMRNQPSTDLEKISKTIMPMIARMELANIEECIENNLRLSYPKTVRKDIRRAVEIWAPGSDRAKAWGEGLIAKLNDRFLSNSKIGLQRANDPANWVLTKKAVVAEAIKNGVAPESLKVLDVEEAMVKAIFSKLLRQKLAEATGSYDLQNEIDNFTRASDLDSAEIMSKEEIQLRQHLLDIYAYWQARDELTANPQPLRQFDRKIAELNAKAQKADLPPLSAGLKTSYRWAAVFKEWNYLKDELGSTNDPKRLRLLLGDLILLAEREPGFVELPEGYLEYYFLRCAQNILASGTKEFYGRELGALMHKIENLAAIRKAAGIGTFNDDYEEAVRRALAEKMYEKIQQIDVDETHRIGPSSDNKRQWKYLDWMLSYLGEFNKNHPKLAVITDAEIQTRRQLLALGLKKDSSFIIRATNWLKSFWNFL
tara:strand:+ start:560 stop:1909 length:1350 start_codon:yes stop_codon:yes gene_type:complete